MKTNLNNRLFTRSSILGASLPAIFTVVLTASTHAATAIWDGAAGTPGNWNAVNWSGSAPVANDILSFGGNVQTSAFNNFGANTQFGSGAAGVNAILFTNDGTAGKTAAFSLSGASITLGGNIVATSSTAAIQDTISNDLLIGVTRVVTAAGNHTIALTGAITINGANAVLNFNNAATLSGAGGAINLNSLNATITYSNTTTTSSLALSRAINANNGAHLSNTSTDVAATITYSGTFTGTANTFVLNGTNTGANDFQSAIGAGAATILLKAGTGSWTVSGLMSSSATTGVSGVTGNLTLSNNANSYTGQTIVTNGTLNIGTIANFGANSAVGNATSGVALRLGNAGTSGILNYTGTGSSSNRTIQIGAGTGTGSATIQNNGGNGGTGLKFTAATSSTAFNSPVASTTNRTLTLGGTNTDANEIQGKIADNTATTGLVAVTKAGAGTWTLSGANTYTGNTTVSGGKLTIASTGTINTTNAVSIGAGEFNYNSSTALSKGVSFSGTGGKLSGTGTISNAVNVTTSNTLAIGNGVGSETGAMAFGNNLAVGGTYLYELMGGGTAADLGDVTGTLTLGGILDLVQLGTYTNGNKFTLFAYDGALSGIFTTPGLVNIADDTQFTDAGGIWKINYNDTSAGLNGGTSASNTYVTITAIPEPNVAALLGGFGTLVLLRRRR